MLLPVLTDEGPLGQHLGVRRQETDCICLVSRCVLDRRSSSSFDTSPCGEIVEMYTSLEDKRVNGTKAFYLVQGLSFMLILAIEESSCTFYTQTLGQ